MNGARRLAGAFWLACCLLLGQQVAAHHALGHAIDRLASQEQLPPAQPCDDCFLGATLSGAVGATLPTLPAVDVRSVAPSVPSTPAAPARARLAYHSRAPPRLS